MFTNASSVIFNVLLAVAFLILPGLALVRLTVPPRLLGLVSRLVIAPGITIAITVLAFVWSDLCGLKPGPYLPWVFLVCSVAVLAFVRPRFDWNFGRVSLSRWLAGLALLLTITIFLIVRFRAAWGWCVPPGVDTEQHTMIVQLLMEHHGLFQSWMPYSDAETFTYHFGFHAIAAAFGWLSRLNVFSAVFIMTQVIAAAAAASLFALVRLWTRSPWGGVFAVVFWELYSDYLLSFEILGRWTLLAGLATLTSALVLLSVYLRPGKLSQRWPLGLLSALTVGGIVLTQYKSAIIFAVLVATLFVCRCLAETFRKHPQRSRRILQLSCRILTVAALAFLLAAPRLHTTMQARAGRYLKQIVLEAPPASSNQFDRPTLTAGAILKSGFETRRKALVFGLALVAVLIVAGWRREALWFPIGWIVVTLAMNPSLIGSARLGLIDETHWRLAVGSAIAVLAGLTLGFACVPLLKTRSMLWNVVPFIAAAALSLRGATGLPSLPEFCRYVLPEDLRLMKWIAANVPDDEMIAGRGFLEHGEALGRDAMMWLPQFTKHRTNHTNLAAGLEKGPVELRQKLRDFTQELSARDMSTPDSARWMRDQGFRWFYVGPIELNLDVKLVEQLALNPGLEVSTLR